MIIKVLCTNELMHAMTVNLKSELRLIIRMFRISEFMSVNKHMVHQRAEALNENSFRKRVLKVYKNDYTERIKNF